MYHNFAKLFEEAEAAGSIAKAVLNNEMEQHDLTEDEVYTKLATRWLVMRTSAQKALEAPRQMTGNLISGQSKKQQKYAKTRGFSGSVINQAMAWALSSSEVNASMGRVCAAPTAGACGVLPAVMLSAANECDASEQEILEALLVAGGAGAIMTRNATVSGAEGGCQAECGVAAAMAAAAVVTLAGGTAQQLGSAVSIALMNCMGLVCDPVAGLVQLPCSFRNASQAVNALISADMALAGQDAVIPPDEAVEALAKVGRSLPSALRETSQGGVAASKTAQHITQALKMDALS
ncbi:L-serine ammonia-lyase, iron-sulfur-dependent, subunit alpha [Ruminococcaceae bacterium OttesenSCG-928-D13]|nr:L-serine ammonia-lyase, iron-sulfur-dependent, subunit alpha [Ruminococcaceae bacterium OttesenSCG-928-D13]